MGLRDRFESLGVPEYLLAQVIWAELEEIQHSPKQLVELARRLFPDGIHERIAQALLPEPAEPRRVPVRLSLCRKTA